MSGLETYRQIKRVNPGSVVVVMTGFSVKDLVKEALLNGAYTVVTKPADPEKLISSVARAYESHRVGRGAAIFKRDQLRVGGVV